MWGVWHLHLVEGRPGARVLVKERVQVPVHQRAVVVELGDHVRHGNLIGAGDEELERAGLVEAYELPNTVPARETAEGAPPWHARTHARTHAQTHTHLHDTVPDRLVQMVRADELEHLQRHLEAEVGLQRLLVLSVADQEHRHNLQEHCVVRRRLDLGLRVQNQHNP